jgi:hypothetical protein
MKKLRTYIIALIPAVILSAANIINPNIDFSGRWVIDLTKSDFGSSPHNLAYKQILVSQNPNSIIIENLLTSKNGSDSSSVETLSYDAKFSKVVLANTAHGIDTRFRAAAFANDGRSLTITENHEINQSGVIGKFKVTEIWTLSESGNELIVKKTFVFTDSTITIKAVYSKLL